MTRRYARFQPFANTTSQRSHTIYTEAQSLDEAVDILLHKKTKPKYAKHRVKDLDIAFGYAPKPKSNITMPKLKFMEGPDPEKDTT